MEAVESMELYEDLDLIDSYVGTSLAKLQEEIDHYMKEPVKEEQPKKKHKAKNPIENPFKGLLAGFMEIYAPIKENLISKRKGPSVAYTDLQEITKEKATDLTFKIYNTYKKTHGMVTFN